MLLRPIHWLALGASVLASCATSSLLGSEFSVNARVLSTKDANIMECYPGGCTGIVRHTYRIITTDSARREFSVASMDSRCPVADGGEYELRLGHHPNYSWDRDGEGLLVLACKRHSD